MMILSNEELEFVFNEMPDGVSGFLKTWGYVQLYRAIEAAILAKLASAKLPEPAMKHYERDYRMQITGEKSFYTADQLRQAYARGAAAQLSEKPSGYLSQYNLEMLQQGYPQTIVMLEGAKRDVPLYTRRQA